MREPISILECTLRDGSYLIDYHFTAEDTYIVCLGLVNAGFKLIEIGHGTGLRSSITGEKKAVASDLEYLEAAQAAVNGSDAKFGMFFIPGIGEMEDLEMAAKCGMGFVRIGTNVNEIDQAEPYIDRAKQLGLEVSSNLMKSYAVTIDDFVGFAQSADRYGADTIVIVDSAGGMFPRDVREYVLRLKDVTEKEIGFHGHNNLQMALANTLEAIQHGCTVVDSSLQGMGRSAGNTQTEILVMALEKLGYRTGINAYKTMDLGERVIKPMMNKVQGVDDISIVSGIAQFHSSFSELIYRAAAEYQIDPRLLIVEVSEIERVNVTKELVEKTASAIKSGSMPKNGKLSIKVSKLAKKMVSNCDSLELAGYILDQMTIESKKTGKMSVFSMTVSENGETSFPFIRHSNSMVIGNCEAADFAELINIASFFRGKVDWLLFDGSCRELVQKLQNENIVKPLLWYSEKRALLLSISTALAENPVSGSLLVLGNDKDVEALKIYLDNLGVINPVNILKNNTLDTDVINGSPEKLGAVISFDKNQGLLLTADFAELLPQDVRIYTVRPNAFDMAFWKSAMDRNLTMFRLDSRIGLAAELKLAIETYKLSEEAGSMDIEGVMVVSGGRIGPEGTVVVDSVAHPSKVIGVADGFGGLMKKTADYIDQVNKVRSYIVKELYCKKF